MDKGQGTWAWAQSKAETYRCESEALDVVLRVAGVAQQHLAVLLLRLWCSGKKIDNL